MRRISYSSRDAAPGQSDAARFGYWCDAFRQCYGATDMTRGEDVPFNAGFDFLALDTIGVGAIRGPLGKIANAGNRTDSFALAINLRSLPITYFHRHREILVAPSMATLITLDEPGGG